VGLELENVGEFYGHLEYSKASWYISWRFGISSPVLVHCSTKNLATLDSLAFSQILEKADPISGGKKDFFA
jgi:hypothetical protein